MKSVELLDSSFGSKGLIGKERLQIESQNSEYEGCWFDLNGKTYRSRLAKKTPTKAGYFVVAWEKDRENVNQAYNFESAKDYLVINIIDNDLRGQFLFPKEILIKKGIIKTEEQKGKMGFRVYLPTEQDLNKTATQTQRWQKAYYTDVNSLN
ncbi:MepB family protein [Vagococcus coleopterorum]|uniref:MepB family protein n=1 Tax=Vagococcus coleopterorum TaxID=2714946 RepID=A0A6G8ANN1_9ENTE|nr:MepB family protein [Vagococcus coleopterorum]QIL46533.1 MepB family protein [Vagococcus coleopterorum]